MNWFVQVQSQNYGPYSDEQMQAFVQEGRVNSQSLITNDVNAGFFHADAFEIFKFWSGTQQIAASGGSAHTYQPISAAPTPHFMVSRQQDITPQPIQQYQPEHYTQNAAPNASSVFLIMAEINSEGTMGFLQTLQNFGQAERLSDTIWLLRSGASVEQLRNALSQSLNRQDRLFLLDSSENKPAWFNIGADLDHRIRDLWEDDQG